MLFSYYPKRQIGKLFELCMNPSSPESPENKSGRGWCGMCSNILAHFRNSTVFDAKILHVSGIDALLIFSGCPPLKYMLSRLSQPEKQELSNEVKDEGIVIEVKPLQKENVLLVDYQYYTL